MTCQLSVREPPPRSGLKDPPEPPVIVKLPQVERKDTLIEIPIQVEGLNADVGPLEAALELSPEVLHVVRMDLPSDVFLGMVDDFMDVVGFEAAIGAERVCVDRRPRLNRTRR